MQMRFLLNSNHTLTYAINMRLVFAGRSVGRSVDWLVGWLVGQLVGLLIGWLAGCLAEWLAGFYTCSACSDSLT